ncbi:hypothetical protein [Chondrinema litorale]|uniref:hypothetical protein n=1 Tax=Chondrinema litorale TaxID=2994555 RepID=UPI002542D14F|nr:hypothetical protein [Chondrinema litorale]UZR99394.1 hypothetical protein OQ292_36025 [Chondrinema litorale]
MKAHIILLSLIFSYNAFAQNNTYTPLNDYNALLNYIPRNLNGKNDYNLDNLELKNLDYSIMHVKDVFALKNELCLTKRDVKWLKSVTDLLASELFYEGNNILLKAVGGASG